MVGQQEFVCRDIYNHGATLRIVGDITANRHGGNPQSSAAHDRISCDKARRRAAVLEAIGLAGRNGLTTKELAEKWECASNDISGRFSELKVGVRPLIKPAMNEGGEQIRRRGSAAWVAAQ